MYAAAPGSCTIPIGGGGCMNRPGDRFVYSVKPPELTFVPDAAWDTFKNRVGPACSRMLAEFWAFPPLILVIVGPVLSFVVGSPLFEIGGGATTEYTSRGRTYYDDTTPSIVTRIVNALFPIFIGFAGFHFLRTCIRLWNAKKDEEIKAACQQLQQDCHGQATVEYRAFNVAPCRSMSARPTRDIIFAPQGAAAAAAGAAPAPMMMGAPCMMGAPGTMPVAVPVVAPGTQMMMVQAPPGSMPGQTVQVQSPDGQTLQLQIPPGVAPGQQFQVQIPAAPVVQVAPVVVSAGKPQTDLF